jgi:nucleoside-diphosphate-sugar epimerase
MKLVVTGALGHIGSKLIREIPTSFQNSEIVLFDNLSTQRYCSLFNLPDQGRYKFIEGDILNADLVTLFDGADYIIHLAAITNAAGSFEIQQEVENVNFVGTEKVAKACIQTGSKLVYISTTSVYGTQSSIVDENCTISELRPQSPYAESKLKSEQLLQNLGTKENLRYVTCRFGTIYGTSIGMRFHTAINKFCWQAVMGIPITVWKTAYEQKRPYLDLNDAIRAIIFIIENGIFNNELYNVLTNNLTVKEICEYIRMFVSNLQIEFVDSRIMNQLSYNVSSEKFSNLGFDSIGDIKAGIENTIKLLGNVNTFK